MTKQRMKSKILFFIIAVIILAGVLLSNKMAIDKQNNRPMPQKIAKQEVPEVSVARIQESSYPMKISGFGEVEPHYSLSLVSSVSGILEDVSPQLEAGEYIKKNDFLLQIDPVNYQQALAESKDILATAMVNLYEMQREAIQAKAEWKRSGLKGQPDSPLVLREPQLAAAQASVDAARSAVKTAEKDLRYTKILAPFDGLVVTRAVSPGSYVQSGTELASLYSTDRFEIKVPLSKKEVAKLPDLTQNRHYPVTLSDVETHLQWKGYVARLEQHIDATNRQQTLVIAVDDPLVTASGLVPGTFVEVNIQGRTYDHLWKLPSSSLSQTGEVWYVENDLLQKFSADVLASDQNFIYILPPESFLNKTTSVLLFPLSSYLPGMKVIPRVEEVSVNG